MNTVNVKKLLGSKWTALYPHNKEKHFMITKVQTAEDGSIEWCELEAIWNKRVSQIDWRTLKNSEQWSIGWN